MLKLRDEHFYEFKEIEFPFRGNDMQIKVEINIQHKTKIRQCSIVKQLGNRTESSS